MTGSVLPANTNCVIPIECVKIENQTAKIKKITSPRDGNLFIKKVLITKKGSVVLKKDTE